MLLTEHRLVHSDCSTYRAISQVQTLKAMTFHFGDKIHNTNVLKRHAIATYSGNGGKLHTS